MKKMLCRLLMITVLLIASCGSDTEMDQDLTDTTNNTGQTDNPPVNDDTDDDGISNADDLCPDTPSGEDVDENGCSLSQLDTDNDGINDAEDQCPDTPENEEVDENGCSTSQKDSDMDGITDDLDVCPDTPEGREVNDQGCHTPKVGEYYQGGYVFYIFQPGDERFVPGEVHGLIAATEAFEDNYPWMPESANYERVFYDDMSRDGEINTAKIVETYGEGTYAAKICQDLELNGYDDWYLGSGSENAILCINLAHNEDPEIADGYSEAGQYWTSFETSAYFKELPQVIYGVQWLKLNTELKTKITLAQDDIAYDCFVTSFDICQTDDIYGKSSPLPVIAIRQF